MADEGIAERPDDLLQYLGVIPGAPPVIPAALTRLALQNRRLEEELAQRTRERNECLSRFHALIEGNGDGIIVVDLEGIVCFVNPAAAQMFGRASIDLLGRPFGHPVVAGRCTEIEVIAPRRPPMVVEMRVVGAEWEGKPSHIALLRDVTDRRRAEEAARRLIRAQTEREAAEVASRRFRFLADVGSTLASSLDYRATLRALAHLCVTELADWSVVYVVEDDGRLQRLEVAHRDPARAEAARRLCDQPLTPADAGPVYEVLKTGEAKRVGPLQRAQIPQLAPGPERAALLDDLGIASYLLVPMIAHDRRAGALAFVSADPERPFSDDDLALARSLASRAGLAVDNARLYAQARAADQAKSDLIAVISHDLRTPLNSIIGYAELMEMGVGEQLGERSRDYVRRMRGSAEHQVHLIDQLLTFSRAESGAVELRPSDVDVRCLLEEVRGMVEPLADRAGLALVVDGRDGVIAHTDADALRQIVLNLATNAVKYTKQGLIRLESDADGAGAVARVRDTGIGIAPEHLSRIFEPFWQAEPGRRGTGLGLSIVRRLADRLGGAIEVESELGRGSTFTLRLPYQPPRSEPPRS